MTGPECIVQSWLDRCALMDRFTQLYRPKTRSQKGSLGGDLSQLSRSGRGLIPRLAAPGPRPSFSTPSSDSVQEGL